MLFKKINSYINWLSRYLSDTNKFKAKNRESKHIYIYLGKKDIYCDDEGRYLYLFLKFLTFTEGNIALVKKFNLWEYRKLGTYGRKIYELDNISFVSKLPKKTEDKVFIYDSKIQPWVSKIWKTSIKLEFDISLPTPDHDDWVFMPFPMYPSSYSEKQYTGIKNLQSSPKKIRILFAGCVIPRQYSETNSKSILKKFQIIPRTTVINTINSHFTKELLAVESWQHMQLLLSSNYQQKCIILSRSKVEIPNEKWLDVLSKSEFFVCAPGVIMPMCHNAIESMAVGTIPITNYPDWFSPSLVHLKNCIRFTTQKDLIEKIELVLTMNQSQVEELHKNVIAYYEEHLSCESFLNNTVYSNKSKLTVFVNAENNYVYEIDKNSIILN